MLLGCRGIPGRPCERREPEQSGFPSWLPWLALPLIALGAYFLMNRDKGPKPVEKNVQVDQAAQMKKFAESQKKGEELAVKAAEKTVQTVKESIPEIDMTAFGGDVSGLFGKLTDTFKGITDVPSAEAAVPGLKDLAGILDGYKTTANKLPAAGKATVKEMVGTNLGTLQPIIDTVLAIPGVGDILRPIVEPMLKTLGSLGL